MAFRMMPEIVMEFTSTPILRSRALRQYSREVDGWPAWVWWSFLWIWISKDS